MGPKKTSKQSQHEKEILKLCGDIITELKPTPVNIKIDLEKDDKESTYGKINKVSVKNVQIEAEPEVAPEEVYIEIKKDQREVPVPVKYTEKGRDLVKPGRSFSGG